MRPRLFSAQTMLIFALWLAGVITTPARTSSAEEGRKPKDTLDSHRVVRGETLWSIALKYNTSVGELLEINHLDDAHVREGQLLKLKAPASASSESASKKTYTVHEGDTLRSIAREKHITEADLAKANPTINPKNLKTGTKLIIPASSTASTEKKISAGSTTNYTAKDGDTFYSIARNTHVSMEDLMTANPNIKPERIYEGLVLKVPVKNGSKSDSAEPPKKSKPAPTIAKETEVAPKKNNSTTKPTTNPKPIDDEPKKVVSNSKPAAPPVDDKRKEPQIEKPQPAGEVHSYIVSEGETADAIASRHHLSARRLLEYNLLPANATLRAGDEIMIPTSGSAKR